MKFLEIRTLGSRSSSRVLEMCTTRTRKSTGGSRMEGIKKVRVLNGG